MTDWRPEDGRPDDEWRQRVLALEEGLIPGHAGLRRHDVDKARGAASLRVAVAFALRFACWLAAAAGLAAWFA